MTFLFLPLGPRAGYILTSGCFLESLQSDQADKDGQRILNSVSKFEQSIGVCIMTIATYNIMAVTARGHNCFFFKSKWEVRHGKTEEFGML